MSDINYLGNTPLGKIQNWQDSKAATITPISFPGKDSGKTEAIDTLGIIAYMNLSGRFTGTFQTIQSYIYAIKGILDGMQTSSQALKSPFINATDYTDTIRVGSMGGITTVTTNKCTNSSATFSTNGIQVNDIVKNLNTGVIAYVKAVDSNTVLSLMDSGGSNVNIFTVIGESYAVTATINVKVLSFEVNWELPGLSYCNYTLSLIQVA